MKLIENKLNNKTKRSEKEDEGEYVGQNTKKSIKAKTKHVMLFKISFVFVVEHYEIS